MNKTNVTKCALKLWNDSILPSCSAVALLKLLLHCQTRSPREVLRRFFLNLFLDPISLIPRATIYPSANSSRVQKFDERNLTVGWILFPPAEPIRTIVYPADVGTCKFGARFNLIIGNARRYRNAIFRSRVKSVPLSCVPIV